MKKLTAKQFVMSFGDEPEQDRIYYRQSLWEAHCKAGVLAMPSGEIGFQNLPDLLSVLAGVGIRRIDVEWDGLPARQLDQTTEFAG